MAGQRSGRAVVYAVRSFEKLLDEDYLDEPPYEKLLEPVKR